MGPRGESCLKCYFFSTMFRQNEGETIEECGRRSAGEDALANAAGLCHRFPPSIRVGDMDHPPEVYSDTWCGEYKNRVERGGML